MKTTRSGKKSPTKKASTASKKWNNWKKQTKKVF